MNSYEEIDILLVEDNPEDAELILRSLKKNSISNCVTVIEDGAEALDFLFCEGSHKHRDCQVNPKVVFLDLKLPKLNGLEVLRIVKEDEQLKKIPVVIITSSKEDTDIKEAYKLGVNSYVVKPIDFDQLMETVKRIGYYWLIVNQTS